MFYLQLEKPPNKKEIHHLTYLLFTVLKKRDTSIFFKFQITKSKFQKNKCASLEFGIWNFIT